MGDFMDSNFDEWKTYWDSVIKKPYVDYRKLKKDKPKYKPNYKNKYWLYEKRNAILKELGYNSYSEYLNIFNSQIKLIFMVFPVSAILGSSIG